MRENVVVVTAAAIAEATLVHARMLKDVTDHGHLDGDGFLFLRYRRLLGILLLGGKGI